MPSFQLSSDARFLTQALAAVEAGETITYEQLSAAIGRDVRQFAKGALRTAKHAQLNDRRVFETDPNIGLRLLTAAEIVNTQAAKGMAHIARTAKRTARKVGAADYATLSQAEQVAHNTQLSMLGAVGHMTKPRAFKALEAVVTERNAELPIGDTLKLMMEK